MMKIGYFDRYEKFTREIGGYHNVHTENYMNTG